MSTEDLKKITDIVAELDPALVAKEVEFMTGGHLKGISYERMRGPVNDEPSPPSMDRLDRHVRRRHREFNKAILAIRVAGEHALRIQAELVSRLTLEQAQDLVEEERGAGTCTNCGHLCEGTRSDRLVETRCKAKCYPYFRAHGSERPQELIDRDIERDLLKAAS